jgi:hypothetical protein
LVGEEGQSENRITHQTMPGWLLSRQETLLGCSSVPVLTMLGNDVPTMDMHQPM